MCWSNGISRTRSAGAPRSSPEAAQRFAGGEGLDGGDPGRSTLDHAADRSHSFHRLPQFDGAQHISNLHLIDGRDRAPLPSESGGAVSV